MPSDFSACGPGFPALRFIAMLKAARDFGLDQRVVNEIALGFDPRESNVDGIADALAAALLRRNTLALPDAL